MLNDTILFAKLSETPIASYGSHLKGKCEGVKVYTVIELLRLYHCDLLMDTLPYCGREAKNLYEMFLEDLLSMSPTEQEELADQIQLQRLDGRQKRTYIIPRKISPWLEEVYLHYIQSYASERLRQKFLAMYHNADRFYEALMFSPQKAFYFDIDPDLDVVKGLWQLTVDLANYLTNQVLENIILPKTDAFKKKCQEFVENLHICHIEAFNRLNYYLIGQRGKTIISEVYNRTLAQLPILEKELLSTSESMARIVFGHPVLVWRTFGDLISDKRTKLAEEFEDLYTLMADLANQSPEENDKIYLKQMFEFLEPYQEDRVTEYIRDHNNTPILYLILAYLRSRPTGSYMDVLARFNGFFGSEQTIEQIASSLGERRNKVVALLNHPHADVTLGRIASYPESKRYNLTQGDWIDLTHPKDLLDEDERNLVEKLNATDEALYYALSTLGQRTLVPVLDRMIGISQDLVDEMDFGMAITSLWKIKFKYNESARMIKLSGIVPHCLKVEPSEVRNMERIEKVLMDLVALIMPDVRIEYPQFYIPASDINAEAEINRFVSAMREISLVNLFDIFTSNYPQYNLQKPIALVPMIELSPKIGYNPRKGKFMPRGPKTVKYPTDHTKDATIEDRSWLKHQRINDPEEKPVVMPEQKTKSLSYDEVTSIKPPEEAPKASSNIKESSDIKSALQAALAITAKLTDVEASLVEAPVDDEDIIADDDIVTPSEDNKTVSFEDEAFESTDEAVKPEDAKEEEPIQLEEPVGLEDQVVVETIEETPEPPVEEESDIADILKDFGTQRETKEPQVKEETEALTPEETKKETAEPEAENTDVVEEDKETISEEPEAVVTAEESVEEEIEESTVGEAEAEEESQEPVTEESVEEESEESTVGEAKAEEESQETVAEEPVEATLKEPQSIEEEKAEYGAEEPAPVAEEQAVVEEPKSSEVPEQPASDPPSEEIAEESPEPEDVPTEEPIKVEEGQVEITAEQPKQGEERESVEQSQPSDDQQPDAPENISEATQDPKQEPEAEHPIVAAQTLTSVPKSISILHDEPKNRPTAKGDKSKKTTKDVVVVSEPQAEMSPYRQAKALEEIKVEEEKKEKEKGKRGRKAKPKPEADLPLLDNIVIVLKNNKSPMTLANIAKSLRKSGIDIDEDTVGDVIFKEHPELFLFFMRWMVGVKEKQYNLQMYKLDPNSYHTFDFMCDQFFAFCDKNGRMPFQNNDEERFLDRWVSRLLDEKVKHTPSQMKRFRQEVVKRRGKILNEEEWNFVENCRKYREYFDEHKSHPNPSNNSQLSHWFNRASQNYNTLKGVMRKTFDELIEYTDKFGLFGLFD